jgi:hypothetical protein
MQQRLKVSAVAFALVVLATIILSWSQRPVQAQTTPDLLVNGAIYGGTESAHGVKGPVPVCYTSGGIACDGNFHVVAGHFTATVASCGASSPCTLSTGGTVGFSAAADFANTNYTCSATIFASASSAYVAYCQPVSSTSMLIYMYNQGPAIMSSISVTVNYLASGA